MTVAGTETLPWFGRQKPVSGLLILQDSGWVSVQISGARPGKIDREGYNRLSADEQFSWLKEYYGYYGRFTLDEAASVLAFDVVDSLIPYERSSILKRTYELSGDTLTLLTEPRQTNGKTTYNRLIWKKAA